MAKYTSRKAYGDTEGPFGFPMPSAVAKEIERIQSDLPHDVKDLGFRRKAAPASARDLGERMDISLVTTDAVDRDREVMLPQGGDWSQWRKNPAVTFAHKYDELPVGRGLWVKRARESGVNGWLAKTQYTERPAQWEGAWFADAVWHFVKSGDLPGKSIGFLPLAASPPEEKEIRAREELAGVTLIIRKWLALEYAVAPLPSNPDAIAVAVGKAKSAGWEVPEVILEEMGVVLALDIPSCEEYYQDMAAKTKPLPRPNRGESEQDFISRCMGNAAMNREYPDEKQRSAICFRQWREEKPKQPPQHIITEKTVARMIAGLDVSKHVNEQIERAKGRV